MPTHPLKRRGRPLAACLVLAGVVTACAQATLAESDGDAGLLAAAAGSGEQPRKPSVGPGSGAQPSAPPAGAGASGCGIVDTAGLCRESVAWWCQDGALVSQDCGALSATCAFRQDLQGFRCDASVPQAPESASPPPEDPNFVGDEPPPPEGEPAAPCNVAPEGECVGDTLRYCLGDALFETDCAALGQSCVLVSDIVGYTCQGAPPPQPPPQPPPTQPPAPPPPEDPCRGVDFLGLCDGNVAVWCENGQLWAIDCAAEGAFCAYIDDQIGFFCLAF